MRSVKWALLVLAVAGCPHTTEVGSLICKVSRDCAPPLSVCSADHRCVPGCVAAPEACVGGATCDPRTGECTAPTTMSCSGDTMCAPPDLVCNTSTSSCVAGCTVSDTCAVGFTCNPATGHCCDVNDSSCPRRPDGGSECNTDSECVGAPANICQGGSCVPGCATGGCTAPLVCDATTGHCGTPTCARDADCDAGSYCTQAGTCAVLAFGGKIACAGGSVVYYHCAVSTSPSQLASCVGKPGPVGCPYCINYSCLHAGLCASDNDCHRGDRCINGLCRVQSSECPVVTELAAVVAGTFAAGKEVCVRGVVGAVGSGQDGMTEIKLGSSPYLYVDLAPWYQLKAPAVGATVVVHGTVRWDDGHDDFELLPVDWISP
jgi:hypothetical protein